MSTKISNLYVPSKGDPSTSKLWIVGEAPGWEEEKLGEPFVGESGKLLKEIMLRNGIDPNSDVYFANLCHYRPNGNVFELLEGSKELEEGLRELQENIRTYTPNLIVALGNQPLRYLTGREGISKWRGSILTTSLDRYTKEIKVIPTYHPAYICRPEGADSQPYFDIDFQRIVEDAKFPELNIPQLDIHINDLTPQAIDELLSAKLIAVDIETIKQTLEIICIGFAVSPTKAYVYEWNNASAQAGIIQPLLLGTVSSKIFHGGIFDACVLRLNGIRVERYEHDTIIQSHILNAELPRDLATLNSIYTRQPYYKTAGRANIPGDAKSWSTKFDRKGLYIYNGTDCCVTYEIFKAQLRELQEQSLYDFYKYEISVNDAFVDLTLEGMNVDIERRNLMLGSVLLEKTLDQVKLNRLCEREINVQGKKTLPDYLYSKEGLGLPERKKRNAKGEWVITTDQDSIVNLIGWCKGQRDNYKTDSKKKEMDKKIEILKLIMKIRERDKLASNYLNFELHEGKCKSIWRADGTETGRPSSKLFFDGSGMNMMTVPRSKVEVRI